MDIELIDYSKSLALQNILISTPFGAFETTLNHTFVSLKD